MSFFSALAKWQGMFSPSSRVQTTKGSSYTTIHQSVKIDRKVVPKHQTKPSSTNRVLAGRITKRHEHASPRDKGKNQAGSTNHATSTGITDQSLDDETLVKEESLSTANGQDDTLSADPEDEPESTAKADLLAKFLDGWSADELWLRERIDKRGEEPLMSEIWQWDFPSFPDSLFTPRKNQALITNIHTSVTEAVDEFAALVDNGARCRDLIDQEKGCESSLAKGIERYRRWSLRDGGLLDKQYLHTTLACAGKRNESVGSVMHRATAKLDALADEWRALFEVKGADGIGELRIPTLCAFVISYSVVQVVCYDANNPAARARTVGMLNHQVVGHDVWHAFAISIICIHARNQLRDLASKGVLEKLHPSIEDVDA